MESWECCCKYAFSRASRKCSQWCAAQVNAIELETVAVPLPAPSVLPSHALQGTSAFTPPVQIGQGKGRYKRKAGVGISVPSKKKTVKGVRRTSFSKPARSNRFGLRLQGLSKDELGRVSSERKALLGKMAGRIWRPLWLTGCSWANVSRSEVEGKASFFSVCQFP